MKGATRNRGEKDRTVRTRSQLREPQRTQERGVKGSAEAQSQVEVADRSRRSQSQFAIRSTQSQVTQVIAIASQTLTLEGDECLILCTVTSGLYTKALLLRSEPTRLTPE